MTPHVENTIEDKKRRGLSCLLHLRCVWSQSVTNTSFTMHVQKAFIWSQQQLGAPSVPAQKYCSENAAEERWCYFPHKQTSDICRLALWTLHLVLLSKSTFDFHNSCLRTPERMMWGRGLPKIGCLFISYFQSLRYCSLYLNIYIYISPERLAWN